ncbi:MAG: tetratricopeptide repeat protein [Candidatus Nanopelagicaceae bacterium]
MTLPPLPQNMGRAFDLSSLTKPKVVESENQSVPEATVENLMTDYVALSKEKPVVLLAYSPRSKASVDLRDLMAEMAKRDNFTWIFGAINADAQPQLVQALQVQSVPFAIAFIDEQPLALFDKIYPQEQIALVITKLFEVAKERGLKVDIPEVKEIPMEPEEVAALSALEKGDYSGAAMAYRNWLQRKPDEQLAKIGLAQCELMIRIEGLSPELTIKDANSHPNVIEKQLMAADIEIAQGLPKNAFERLITLVRNSAGEDKKRVKEHLLLLFQLVDPSDPELIRARNELASALF